jgi:hypothetical protein
VALEGGDHILGVAATHRHHVDRGEAQISADSHFGNRDHVRFDDGIVHIATGKHFSKRVPHEFANAQLTLRASGRRLAMMFVSHRLCPITSVSACPGHLGQEGTSGALLIGLRGTSPGMTVEMAEKKSARTLEIWTHSER